MSRLAIADPPYPPLFTTRYDRAAPRVVRHNRASRWYAGGAKSADAHPAAAEWDDPARHRQLIEQLAGEYDGYAIATTPDGLQAYGPLPPDHRLLVWVKTRAMPGARRIAAGWEPVILVPPIGRRARDGAQVADVLQTATPQGFPGAKPAEWTRWVLDALGYDPATDTIADLFPGSGAVSREIAQGTLL